MNLLEHIGDHEISPLRADLGYFAFLYTLEFNRDLDLSARQSLKE